MADGGEPGPIYVGTGPLPAYLRTSSLLPFWFWNDDLTEAELLRQIGDFEAHGVHGFVIHPRLGLPRSIGWMSDALLSFMRIAVDEARRRAMTVILYDEGMYPSGSSSGQVVASRPELATRALSLWDPAAPLPDGAQVISEFARPDGTRHLVLDLPSGSTIRGLHYLDEASSQEDAPPAADILDPRTAEVVLELVYDRYHRQFGADFGRTIIGIFTDEPNALGKVRNKQLRPGTSGILAEVRRLLGYEFEPYLDRLWFDDHGDAARYRRDYQTAIGLRLEETWYAPLSRWCREHGVALCGHPRSGDELGVQRFFQIPGQDLVWRRVRPDTRSALKGPESTQAKVTSSAMQHAGGLRNSNEFGGAYGHETSFDEFRWLADWCLIRGVNLLIPHAFYYSTRGPRRDERPPQAGGLGCAWWDRFAPFAHHCAFLSWLNTGSRHVCEVAILTDAAGCAWQAARALYERQIDFNYLCEADLAAASADPETGEIRLGDARYSILIVDGISGLGPRAVAPLRRLLERGRVLRLAPAEEPPGQAFDSAEALAEATAPLLGGRLGLSPPSPHLRVRRVVKDGQAYLLFFNEGKDALQARLVADEAPEGAWIDTESGLPTPASAPWELALPGHGTAVLQLGVRFH